MNSETIIKWVIVYIVFALVFGIVFALFYPEAAGLCGLDNATGAAVGLNEAKTIAVATSAAVSFVAALFVVYVLRRYI